MIQEIARIIVSPDQHHEFETVFPKAITSIATCKGYMRHELHKGIENPNEYLLCIYWQTLEDHIVGFRQSENFQDWRRQIQKFFSQKPVVEHYVCLIPSE